MQFVPGHFSCDVVWGTVIRVHSRLKMGPSMGVSRGMWLASEGRWIWGSGGPLEKGASRARVPPCAPVAIQALRSVLNAFSVVNRKNMFVYQERATKAVYYLR